MKHLSRILAFLFLLPPVLAKAQFLEVAVAPDFLEIQADQNYYYNFGHAALNTTRWTDIILRNKGPGPLIVRGVFVAGVGFWAWSDCPPYLGQGQWCRTQVEFRPLYEGYFSGRLRFAFTNDNIYIDLHGWGTRWP